MKKRVLAALVPAALLGAGPAFANGWYGQGSYPAGVHGAAYGPQDWHGNGYPNGHYPARPGYGQQGSWRWTPALANAIRTDVQDLKNQIDRAYYRHRIGRNDAVQLRREALDIQRHSVWARRDGLSRDEVRILQDRVNRVRDQLRLERRDWYNWRG